MILEISWEKICDFGSHLGWDKSGLPDSRLESEETSMKQMCLYFCCNCIAQPLKHILLQLPSVIVYFYSIYMAMCNVDYAANKFNYIFSQTGVKPGYGNTCNVINLYFQKGRVPGRRLGTCAL